jgi:hypothetical protein
MPVDDLSVTVDKRINVTAGEYSGILGGRMDELG